MVSLSKDLQVSQPTVTTIGNTFVSIENYLSIITYETDIIKIKLPKTKGGIIGANYF